MIDWIGRARTHFADKLAESTDKTDEIGVSSVLSGAFSCGDDNDTPSFDSFVGSFRADFVNTHILFGSMPPIPELESEWEEKMAPPEKGEVESCHATALPYLNDECLPASNEPLSSLELLDRFNLDMIEVEIAKHAANGFDPDEIRRVNNLAYFLFAVKGWEFDVAMTKAAEWVIGNAPHLEESRMADVLALYQRKISAFNDALPCDENGC